MVRKTLFTKEDVIAAGIAVVEKSGLNALSARRLAEELGSSTAPVYSNFSTMEAVETAVKSATTDLILEFTRQEFTDDAFLNMGIGILEFARQKPALYQAIFMNECARCESGARIMSELGGRMANLPELAELPESERLMLLHQMGIFTQGLASQVSSGMVEHHSFDDLIIFLEDAGDAMVQHALSKPERTPEQVELLRTLMEFSKQEAENND